MKELYIEAKIENLESVLAFLANELEAADCSMELITHVTVAVEEIFVNIARYAYYPEVGGVVIRVSVDGGVIIEFTDGGKPFNPLDKSDPDVAKIAEGMDIGGLGIFMVKNIMDAVEYCHIENKNILKIKKNF